MYKQTYLPLLLAMTLAPMAVNAGSIHYADNPDACLGEDGIKDKDEDKIPDFAGKPDETPPDFAGKPDETPPDFAGPPDETPPDFAGPPDETPPDFAGPPDETPPDFAGNPNNGPDLDPSAVPVPAAAWLLGSGLVGLMGVARRRNEK